MAIITCPTDLVRAPAGRVWDLLTIPRDLEAWSGAKVLERPPRRLAEGENLVLGAGLGHRFLIHFHICRITPAEELAIEIALPFGVTNHEVIRITAAGAGGCRVTFN